MLQTWTISFLSEPWWRTYPGWMGAWSAEPFGNDAAADWAWELAAVSDWGFVHAALTRATRMRDVEHFVEGIAAAETVAHGCGRPTQSDVYTEDVTAFVKRLGAPPEDLTRLALSVVEAADKPSSELAELWEGDSDWHEANARLIRALAS